MIVSFGGALVKNYQRTIILEVEWGGEKRDIRRKRKGKEIKWQMYDEKRKRGKDEENREYMKYKRE